MPFVHGKSAFFKLATTDLSTFMDNIDFPHESDDHETTTYTKSYKTRIGGLKDASFNVGGLYSVGAAEPETIIPPLIGTVAVFEYGPEGNTSGKVKYSGSCLVKNYNHSTPVGDVIRWTATFMATDTVTKGVFA